ncbi:unnamed protein product [Mucor circinelloides]
MESIFSTFIGLVFPHKIELHEYTKVYINLYESYSARYSVKIVLEKQLFLDALSAYNPEWSFGSLASLKQPMILAVSGPMKQQPTLASFKGDAVEEKFHMRAVTASFIPCIPLVSNKLRKMVHPTIAPVEIEQGNKEGFFSVNLSLKKGFQEPEFQFSDNYKPRETDDLDDMLDDSDEESLHNDEEELPDSAAAARRRAPKTFPRPQGEIGEEEEFQQEFDGMVGVQRFNDFSEDEEAGTNTFGVQRDTGEGNNDGHSGPSTWEELAETDERNARLMSEALEETEEEYRQAHYDKQANNGKKTGRPSTPSFMEMEDTDFLDYCMKNLVEDNEAKDGDEAEDVDEFENDEKIDTLWPFDSNDTDEISSKSTPSVFTKKKNKNNNVSERIQEDENKDKHDHIQHRSKSRIRKRIIISDDEEDESESDDQSAVKLTTRKRFRQSSDTPISMQAPINIDSSSDEGSQPSPPIPQSTQSTVISNEKRPRGRPRLPTKPLVAPSTEKRKPGRPRKDATAPQTKTGPLDAFIKKKEDNTP